MTAGQIVAENKLRMNHRGYYRHPLQLYHVFHIFIPEGGDERDARLYSHSQGDWDELKRQRGQIWTLPSELLTDSNVIDNHKMETAEDWWQYATAWGYMPQEM